MVTAIFNTPTEEYASPTRPPTSSPSVAANLLLTVGRLLVYLPSLDTSPNLLRRFSRGTLTWEKRNAPLSTPLRPTLWPQSWISTPGRSAWVSRSRIGTMNVWMPISADLPPFPWRGRISRANTLANLPWTAALPIHHLIAPSFGVFITNSSVIGSKVAVVCRPWTLEPVWKNND